VFSIQNGVNVSLIDKSYQNGSVGEFFGFIKGGKLLSKKDEKAHAMILRLYAYPNSQLAEFEVVCHSLFVSCSAKWWFQSDDEEMLPLKSMGCKRCHQCPNHASENVSNLVHV
jgi:hypothetical protein